MCPRTTDDLALGVSVEEGPAHGKGGEAQLPSGLLTVSLLPPARVVRGLSTVEVARKL